MIKTWQDTIAFTPTQQAFKQKLNFDLYKDGYSDVYRNTYLYINVSDL